MEFSEVQLSLVDIRSSAKFSRVQRSLYEFSRDSDEFCRVQSGIQPEFRRSSVSNYPLGFNLKNSLCVGDSFDK